MFLGFAVCISPLLLLLGFVLAWTIGLAMWGVIAVIFVVWVVANLCRPSVRRELRGLPRHPDSSDGDAK